ncbi:MAG: hypothetical protein LBU39_08980 [Desulfobulbaceae bacterium]|nr:hypothetical protein [Desulfobulbaceae bacterium]
MAQGAPRRTIRFELTWRGVLGIAALVFCLFLWMFILGIWAGQTISSPSDPTAAAKTEAPPTDSSRR